MKSQIVNLLGEVKVEWNPLKINEIISAIDQVPGMFIGNEHKLSYLWHYLEGYKKALNVTGQEIKSFPNYSHFSDWLLGILKQPCGGALSWNCHLLQDNDNDEENAFLSFFENYKIFSKSKPECYELILNKRQLKEAKNLPKKSSTNPKLYDYNNLPMTEIQPSKILVFQLPPSKSCWINYFRKDETLEYSDRTRNIKEGWEILTKQFGVKSKEFSKLGKEKSLELYTLLYL